MQIIIHWKSLRGNIKRLSPHKIGKYIMYIYNMYLYTCTYIFYIYIKQLTYYTHFIVRWKCGPLVALKHYYRSENERKIEYACVSNFRLRVLQTDVTGKHQHVTTISCQISNFFWFHTTLAGDETSPVLIIQPKNVCHRSRQLTMKGKS